MKEAVRSLSNQQEAERAVVALKVVAKQLNDRPAELSAELIDTTQRLLFQKNRSSEEQKELIKRINTLLGELEKAIPGSKRANFHSAIVADLQGISKSFSSRNVSTALGLLNCAITNAFSVYNIERVKGNIQPNYHNPLMHNSAETQIIELDISMLCKD